MNDKTPWEKELLEEHLEVIKEECKKINNKNLRENLLHQANKILNQISGDETIYAGTIYSLIARKNSIASSNSKYAVHYRSLKLSKLHITSKTLSEIAFRPRISLNCKLGPQAISRNLLIFILLKFATNSSDSQSIVLNKEAEGNIIII